MTAARPTIFALSSGPPPCAIAVIRISGPAARRALEQLIGRVPEPRVATFARVCDPADGGVIDEGLALWFPGPKSETGEDVVELQVHGGRAVVAAVLKALGRIEGFRHAEAGEFTRRAFENGRLDLTAVEGLADVVAAETEAQRRQALRQMQGEFARQISHWREQLIAARALLEAGIDFSDEADVPANLTAEAVDILTPVLRELGEAQKGRGERLRDGLQVVIAGAPNVGKSTLLNRLAQRDVAIV
jgi:tRNA modification GTPase